MQGPGGPPTIDLARIRRIQRPHPRLVKLYLLGALVGSLSTCGLALPVALLALIPLLIRYNTLRYRFDETGVGVSWGWLFRSESYLTYDKIQDIHLTRGLLERWLGLGTVDVQTASGNAGAEITFIGLTEFDAVRDFLYSRMRRGKGLPAEGAAPAAAHAAQPDEALALLAAIRDEVTALREQLRRRAGGQS
ncbi:MAG: PH domain-containing protein [Vicinamibacteria bacterium]|jgi:putative membrane protein|nr:PH domain-containing protein [Vicinamibacteria bacterium]